MSTVIKVENLSKVFGIGHRGKEQFWALRDINFSMAQGEVVGIIGRNGAGKSTLLKILSRITGPSHGRISVTGRMGSLLEVGTGFHPELTGRENVFLNGAILGMTRDEVRRKFDEIVDFADIRQFIDTPVKRYSSGMYVRLGFAVAAHLDLDILVIDEVLSVGDTAFQKKCLAKVEDASGQGRTIIFVSHNLGTVRQLCPRSIYIEKGKIVADGNTNETIRAYQHSLRANEINENTNLKERLLGHSGAVRFTSLRIEDTRGRECFEFRQGQTVRVRTSYEVFEDVSELRLDLGLQSDTTGELVAYESFMASKKPLKKGFRGIAIVELPQIELRPREYLPYLWLGDNHGKAFDRLNYQWQGCPPIVITGETKNGEPSVGYIDLKTRLLLKEPSEKPLSKTASR